MGDGDVARSPATAALDASRFAQPLAAPCSPLQFTQQGELPTISFCARLGYSGDIRIVLKSGDIDDRAFRNPTLDRDDCERAGIVIGGIGAIRPAAQQPSNAPSRDEPCSDESCGRFAAAGRAFESRGVMS
jgi:hypothetical protein